MLFKLLKYDLQYSMTGFLSLASAIIAVSLAVRLSSDFLYNLAIVNIGLNILFMAVSIAVIVMSIIFIHQNYATSLFGSHGYLMFTLPVKPVTLLTSKFITSLIWLNFMFLASFISSLIIAWDVAYVYSPFFDTNTTFSLIIFAIIHYNFIGFLLISIFFVIITLSHSYIKGRRIHGIFSTIIGISYFVLWSEILNWFYLNVVEGIGDFGFTIIDNTFMSLRVDFFLLLSSVIFGLIASLAILKLFKRMELR